MLSHSGSVKRDSLDESAFMALSISMTTKLSSLMRDPLDAGRLLTSKAILSTQPLRCRSRTSHNQFLEIVRNTDGNETTKISLASNSRFRILIK